MIRKTVEGHEFESQMIGELHFDKEPVEGSFNPVTSDGVAKSIGEAKEDMQEKIDEVTLDPSAVALGNVHLLNEETKFPADGCILIDSETNGPGEMSKDTLLELTSQNALAGNVAPAFDPTRTSDKPYKAGESVAYEGKTYTFKVDHYGVWVDADAYPFSADSFVKSIENLTGIGNKEINSSYLFSFTPDFGQGKISSSAIYNAYVFDVGVGVVVENITVNGFTGIAQTDSFPKPGDYFAESSRVAFTTMKHRYLVVSVKVSESPTTCTIKTRFTTPANNEEVFSDIIGFNNDTANSGPFFNIVPDFSNNGIIAASSLIYNSYVFDIGKGSDFEISGSAFLLTAQTDIIPKIGDQSYCENRASSGHMFHRYLIVTVSLSSVDRTIQVSKKGRGVLHSLDELQKKSSTAYELYSSDSLAGIVPEAVNYANSTSTYDSFVFDIGAGKQYSIKVYGADFVLAAQDNNTPVVGQAHGSVRYRVTDGIMTKRYLVVCVNKLNKTGIGCVVSILGEGKKKIKALFIGNSVNQDHVMYAPWFLYNEYKNDLVFEIGNFYIASYTIKAYVENCVNGSRTADIYSTAYGTPSWTNIANTELLEDAIESNDWDIICVQGYYNNGVLGPEDMSYLADLVQFISDHAAKPFTLAFMMHQTYTTGALTRIIDGTEYSVENSSVRLIFPCGLATEFVKGEWLQSFLTSDNIHNQEGLPCILGGYVVGDVLARFVGLPSRVMGNKRRMTSQEHEHLNIAGQNGTFQAGTDTQFDQAQIAACKAVNAGCGVLTLAQQEMIPQE